MGGLRVPTEAAGVWAAGVGLVLLLAFLASFARSWGAAVAAAGVLAVGAFYARLMGLQVGLVLLLIVTATADRFTFPIGPLALRAEQVAALAGLVALAVSVVRMRRWELLKPNLPEGLLLVWFACNLVSSLVASPDRRLSAKILALFLICSLGLFLPRRLIAGARAAERMEVVAGWLLVAFATEAGYVTIVYLLHVFGPTVSLGVNPATSFLGAYGTLWEQNVLGAFGAAGVIAWAYLGPRRFRGAWIGIAACMGGLTASLTRAAWLAAFVVGGAGLLFPGMRRRLDLREVAKGGIAGLVVVGAILLVDRSGKYSVQLPGSGGVVGAPARPLTGWLQQLLQLIDRLPNRRGDFLSAVFNRVDLIGRLNQVSLVEEDIRHNLLLGRGTAGFEALHQVNGAYAHLATLPLNVLDGTGLVGLALFTAFALAVAARAWRYRADEVAFAFGQVGLVVAITNLSTETMELMIGWLLIGLLLAATDAAQERAPATRLGSGGGGARLTLQKR
jgi:hypothetical protein